MKNLLKTCLILLGAMLFLTACGGEQKGIQPNEPANQGEQIEENNNEDGTKEGVNNQEQEEKAENTQSVTLFFPDQDLMNLYGEEQQIKGTTDLELAKAALEAWITGPKHEELKALVPAETAVQFVEDRDGIAYVSFSNHLKQANLGSGGEAFVIDSIALIMEQFGFPETQILIDNQIEETLLGHMYIGEPYKASDAQQYVQK